MMSPYLQEPPRSIAAVCAEMLRRALHARRDAAARGNSEWRRRRCLELARAYERKTRDMAQGTLPGVFHVTEIAIENGSSATCSKCGADALSHSLRYGD